MTECKMWVCVHVRICASFCVYVCSLCTCVCVCACVCVSVHECVCGKFVQASVRMYCMRLTACSGAVGRTKLTQGLIHRIRYRPIINATPMLHPRYSNDTSTLHQCYINATTQSSMLQWCYNDDKPMLHHATGQSSMPGSTEALWAPLSWFFVQELVMWLVLGLHKRAIPSYWDLML